MSIHTFALVLFVALLILLPMWYKVCFGGKSLKLKADPETEALLKEKHREYLANKVRMEAVKKGNLDPKEALKQQFSLYHRNKAEEDAKKPQK